MKNSRGEYISFIDDDDVVYCEKYIELEDDKARVYSYQTGAFVKEPTLITNELNNRVNDLFNGRFLWSLWSGKCGQRLFQQN